MTVAQRWQPFAPDWTPGVQCGWICCEGSIAADIRHHSTQRVAKLAQCNAQATQFIRATLTQVVTCEKPVARQH